MFLDFFYFLFAVSPMTSQDPRGKVNAEFPDIHHGGLASEEY